MIKKTAVINDLSGFGKCSLVASISILSVMGVQPCAVPTAILTNQTGYDNYYSYDFSQHMRRYAEIWSGNNVQFDGIYSGYVTNAEQLDIISDFIDRFKTPETTVLVDTVLGDNGKMYKTCSDETCRKMRRLIKKADIITPNLTELCLITENNYSELVSHSTDSDYLERIAALSQSAARAYCKQIIVTGIKKDDYVYNGVFSKDGAFFEKTKHHGDSFSGTGDIFASIIFASAVKGVDIKSAVKTAAAFIEKSVADTVKNSYDRNDGINFEKYLYTLGGNNE